MKIAYIEDDKDSSLIFSRKLKSDGFQCDVFPDAESVLSQISSGAYDVLVTDIRLPGLSGVELLAELRKRHVYTPCVLITAFNSLALAKQALNANASYLLEKPFTYQGLRRVIEKVLETHSSLQYFLDRGLARLNLTNREEEMARFLLKGLSNGEIARVASLSEKTVKQYVTQIFEKAAVQSRAEFFSSIFSV